MIHCLSLGRGRQRPLCRVIDRAEIYHPSLNQLRPINGVKKISYTNKQRSLQMLDASSDLQDVNTKKKKRKGARRRLSSAR
jgi:hypothetical protein